MRFFRYLILLFLLPLAVKAQQFPEKPNPPRLVNDFTKTLSAEEVNSLEQKLLAYNDSTSTQVAIVMISSLDGYPVDDYAIQLAEKWGIGQKGKDNGILIFVAKDDRKIFIPTGYGMEGVMPDGLVKRIIENDMKPYFKENRFYDGFDNATNSIFRLAAGEYTADTQSKPKETLPGILIFLAMIVVFILVFIFKVRSVKTYSNVNGISFWAAWMLLNQARRTHTGSWGGFSGGGGSWGGGSGGGFGGFGGGSFGGGGAGGSW